MVTQLVSEQALVETYEQEVAWETVQQYRQAVQLANEETDLARAEIARCVGRSPSTVRGWLVEGKRPAPVKAIETAREHGWLNVESCSEMFRALNQLVAWVFAGGGIRRDGFVPIFSVDDQLAHATLHRLLTWAQVSSRVREYEGPDQALEIIPSTDATVLGRVLHVLNAPIGVKATHDDLSLPAYLETVAESHRRDFARIYLLNRGAGFETTASDGVRIAESRSTKYCRALRDFFSSIMTGSITLGSQDRLWISAEAIHELAAGAPIRPKLGTLAAYGSLTPPTIRAVTDTYRRSKRPGGYRYGRVAKQIIERSDNPPLSELKSHYPDFPEQTLRNWQRGHTPRATEVLTEVHDLGWATPPTASDTALGLTSLAAWIFARGTLRTESYHPVFRVATDAHHTTFQRISETLGFSYSRTKEDDSSRPTELHPSTHGGVLGRVLYALGSPLGRKRTTICLPPSYLYAQPSHARRFITMWCQHHTSEATSKQVHLNVPSALGDQFTKGLISLMRTQYGETITQATHGIAIDAPSDEFLKDVHTSDTI